MWLTDLRLVLPERVVPRGALRLHDGRIDQVVEGDAPAPGIPCDGLTALPGIVDLHGDMFEREVEPRPDAFIPTVLALHELDKRCVSAGITTAYAAISFAWRKGAVRQQEMALAMISAVNQNADTLLCDMRVHARFEVTNADTVPLLERLLDAGQVQLVSLMDHTPGQGQYKDIDRYVDFMTRWLGVDAAVVGERVLDEMKARIRAQTSAPRDWQVVAGIAALARAHGVPLASHDDDTPEKVAQMAALGITISEFPVTLEAAQAARAAGMHVLMGAPNAYRGSSNTNNLSALDGLRAGVVDSLATDYVPAAPLHAAFRLAATGVMPLAQAVATVSANPAAAAGLHDRGALRAGLRADVVLAAEPTQEGQFPRVHAVFRAGEPVYWDASMARRAAFLRHTTA